MVGARRFQTKLKYAEQVRVFKTIPGLENAEFARLGGLHRNTFLNSPLVLDNRLRLKARPALRFAGQITGCEGYVESAAVGLIAGRLAASERLGVELDMPPDQTAFFGKVKGRGEDPAAEADILNADVRPYRDGTAAASDDDGRGVDHGRGYKAAPGFRQDVPPSFPGQSGERFRGPSTASRLGPQTLRDAKYAPKDCPLNQSFALCESEAPTRETFAGLDSGFVPSPDSPAGHPCYAAIAGALRQPQAGFDKANRI